LGSSRSQKKIRMGGKKTLRRKNQSPRANNRSGIPIATRRQREPLERGEKKIGGKKKKKKSLGEKAAQKALRVETSAQRSDSSNRGRDKDPRVKAKYPKKKRRQKGRE